MCKNANGGHYKSRAAREAQEMNYGTESYWQYLDDSAAEDFAKGIKDAYTQTLAEALDGNDGD